MTGIIHNNDRYNINYNMFVRFIRQYVYKKKTMEGFEYPKPYGSVTASRAFPKYKALYENQL